MNTKQTRNEQYVKRCIKYLKRHHEHIFTLVSTNKNLGVTTTNILFFDMAVVFVTSKIDQLRVKTNIYDKIDLTLILDEGYDISWECENERSKYRYFLPAQQAQQ